MFNGFLYGPSGQQIYGTPRESPGRYRPRPLLNREIKRSISQYDHAELVSLSASICCRIPALRAAIRDKNDWAFANWIPVYLGEDEAWGEAAEEYLMQEVLPHALLRELRTDFTWGMKVSGMGLDMHGDDLCIFTEDEQHNPRVDFVPAPRIGNGLPGFQWVSTMYSGAFMQAMRADGMGEVQEGPYKGLPIYNGVIRNHGRPVAVRVLGFKANGETIFNDFDLTNGMAHYACEMEFFGQGRGLPRAAASILQWMNKEDIDDQFLKGLKNAAERTVIHKLPPGQDVTTALGNAIETRHLQVPKFDRTTGDPVLDGNGNQEEEEHIIHLERTADGTVAYIGSDEELAGLDYKNPHPNGEAYIIRVQTEALADIGWSWSLIDTSNTSRAPTRLETSKANNSIGQRQMSEDVRSIRFFQYAIASGMNLGRLKRNNAGMDPWRWAVGYPAQMSVDQGNDVTAALNRLKMGLTNERIEAAKDGYIAKHIARQRDKEIIALIKRADKVWQVAQGLGHKAFTFDQARELLYQPNPNATAQPLPPPDATGAPAMPTDNQPPKS